MGAVGGGASGMPTAWLRIPAPVKAVFRGEREAGRTRIQSGENRSAAGTRGRPHETFHRHVVKIDLHPHLRKRVAKLSAADRELIAASFDESPGSFKIAIERQWLI
jgi:hypothetical protein